MLRKLKQLKTYSSALQGLPLLSADHPHPLVLVSHGVGGNRMVHCLLCTELASQVISALTGNLLESLLQKLANLVSTLEKNCKRCERLAILILASQLYFPRKHKKGRVCD